MKSYLRFGTLALVVGIVYACACPATADFVSPVAVTDNSPEYTDYGFSVAKMIDGIYGSSASGLNAGILNDDTLSDTVCTGHIVFDMGSSSVLGGAKLWVRNLPAGMFAKNVDFFYYTDDNPSAHAVKDDIGVDPGIVSVWNNDLPNIGDGAFTEVTFTSPLTARYVGIRVNSSWNEPPDPVGTGSVQIQEVMFDVVPEPSTVVLLGTALIGLLAYAWRKRR